MRTEHAASVGLLHRFVPLFDFLYVALTLAVFALLALIAKGVEKL